MQKLSRKTACLILTLVLFISCRTREAPENHAVPQKDELVILLHGLARSRQSMEKIEKRLSRLGYRVVNLDYPSTKKTIPLLADEMLSGVVKRHCGASSSKIHFVTHSMGGIVVRYYLKHHKLLNLGRIVMISPPNKGTELVNFLDNSRIFAKFNTPSGRQMGTEEGSIPLRLGPVDFELGVIAGDRSFNPLYSAILPGSDDGVVSVERTKVEGMKDFIVLPYCHTFIMQRDEVIEQVIHFLEQGAFKKNKS